MTPRSCFVTGTDTGVGKTLVTCALLHAFAARGLRVAGMKPVASGCRSVGNVLVSEDAERLLAAGNLPLTLQQINPYAFEPPLAPHIAAAMAGKPIVMARILETFDFLCTQADRVVVEGVGGFCVPLNDHEDAADIAGCLDLPVVLVVGMRLGCINHALLTAEAVRQRGLRLAGWIANCIDPQMQALESNVRTLKARLPAECLGVIPYQAIPDAFAMARYLDVIQ